MTVRMLGVGYYTDSASVHFAPGSWGMATTAIGQYVQTDWQFGGVGIQTRYVRTAGGVDEPMDNGGVPAAWDNNLSGADFTSLGGAEQASYSIIIWDD